jgi:RNA polymerase sigma-70 factor, ECF subfamily
MAAKFDFPTAAGYAANKPCPSINRSFVASGLGIVPRLENGSFVEDLSPFPHDRLDGGDAPAAVVERRIAAVRLALQSGSASSVLGSLLEGYRDYLLLVANRELAGGLHQKAAPSDIVQETMIEAFRGFVAFTGTSEAELLGWLRQILVNNLTDAARRYQGTAKRDVLREQYFSDSRADLAHQLVDPQPTPMSALLENESTEQLFLAMSRLPDHYRRVIVLRNLELLTFPQVGEQLRITEAAAYKLWLRAIKRLSKEV